MRSAALTKESFEPREGFETQALRDARPARIWYSPAVARWRLERGGTELLSDGAAVGEAAVGSTDWLVGEIFSYRGEAIVLEPEDLRLHIAERARQLADDLALVTTAR
jgi:predicted DNA-binding transcriptional regulator YafY